MIPILLSLAAAVIYTNQPPPWPLNVSIAFSTNNIMLNSFAATEIPLPDGTTQTFLSNWRAPKLQSIIPRQEVAILFECPIPAASYLVETSPNLKTWEFAMLSTNSQVLVYECELTSSRFWRISPLP